MAKLIATDTGTQSISASYSWWQITLVGALLGVIYWGLAELLGNYTDTVATAGYIATILVATFGISIMLRARMAQPLIIAIATGITLWGLSQLTRGLLWSEAIAWSIALYGLAYALFSWIARYTRPVPVFVSMIIVIIAVHIASNL